MTSLFCSFVTFSKEKCDISPRYPGVTEYFPLTSCKKDIRSHLRTVKVSQTNILTEKHLILARTGQFNEDGTNIQYVRDTELNMAYFGDRWENVRILFTGIARASQRGERRWRWARKLCQSGTHSFQSEQVREECILAYRILKFHDALGSNIMSGS